MVEQELPYTRTPLEVFNEIENNPAHYAHASMLLIPVNTVNFDFIIDKDEIEDGELFLSESRLSGASSEQIFLQLQEKLGFASLFYLVRKHEDFTREINPDVVRDGMKTLVKKKLASIDSMMEAIARGDLGIPGDDGGIGTSVYADRMLLHTLTRLLDERAESTPSSMKK